MGRRGSLTAPDGRGTERGQGVPALHGGAPWAQRSADVGMSGAAPHRVPCPKPAPREPQQRCRRRGRAGAALQSPAVENSAFQRGTSAAPTEPGCRAGRGASAAPACGIGQRGRRYRVCALRPSPSGAPPSAREPRHTGLRAGGSSPPPVFRSKASERRRAEALRRPGEGLGRSSFPRCAAGRGGPAAGLPAAPGSG